MAEFSGMDEALGASARQENQARQSLDRVMSSLRAVDAAYASGNARRAYSLPAGALQLEQHYLP